MKIYVKKQSSDFILLFDGNECVECDKYFTLTGVTLIKCDVFNLWHGKSDFEFDFITLLDFIPSKKTL